ncbi:MAG: riboflavin synthase, partial [Planctomycetota bacterium]
PPTPAGRRLRILPDNGWAGDPRTDAIAHGASIAISGCCLTVAEAPDGKTLAFDVIPETLEKTTLGGLTEGDRVNLEPAATATTALDGHIVQGHVEGTGRVVRIDTDDGWRVRIAAERPLMEAIVPKGSVTIDGVSLTIAAVEPGDDDGGWFEVALIPTTLELTTLGGLSEGSRVNLETDAMVRAVVHWMRHFGR